MVTTEQPYECLAIFFALVLYGEKLWSNALLFAKVAFIFNILNDHFINTVFMGCFMKNYLTVCTYCIEH